MLSVSFKNCNRCNFYFTITSLSFWVFPISFNLSSDLCLSTPPLTWRSLWQLQFSGPAPRLTCTPNYSVYLLLMELNPKSYCQSPHQHGFILLVHSHSPQLLSMYPYSQGNLSPSDCSVFETHTALFLIPHLRLYSSCIMECSLSKGDETWDSLLPWRQPF